MTSPVQHTSFVIERMLKTSPHHAFKFWSDADLKGRWNSCHPDWMVEEDLLDFRVGGLESKRWRTGDNKVQAFSAYYLDIVPDQRIIYSYEMSFAGARLSASLVTILLAVAGTSCRMTYTEQVAILSGGSDARQQRLMGTEQGIDRLLDIIAQGEHAAS